MAARKLRMGRLERRRRRTNDDEGTVTKVEGERRWEEKATGLTETSIRACRYRDGAQSPATQKHSVSTLQL